MPKVGKSTEDQKALAKEIRDQFGGAHVLNLEQVKIVIGAKSPHKAYAWLSDLTPRMLNGRKHYLISDVAAKLLES